MQYVLTSVSAYTEMCQGTQNYSYSTRNNSTYGINESTYNIHRHPSRIYTDICLYILCMCTATAHTEIQSHHIQKYTFISEHMQKCVWTYTEMCRNTRTTQTRADIQVRPTHTHVEHKQYRNVQKYKKNAEMCRNTGTTQTEIQLQCAQRYDVDVWTLQKYMPTFSEMSTFTKICQHVQKCSLITYRSTLTNHYSYLSEQPQERMYRIVSTYTEIPLNDIQKYMSTFTEMCQHIQRYTYITDKKYKYNTDICRNTSPPAPMNHVIYLRAGPAKMPFRNWYTANTDHFHLTDSVRWKWKLQPNWVIKPVTHDFVRRSRFGRIKISGTRF